MEKYIVNSVVPGIIGDSNRYKTKKGIIYLVEPCKDTFNSYEIFCLKGDLFYDVERYSNLEAAEERIKNLLE